MKKVAVVLSGCGFKDGTEITEAVSVMLALDEMGVTPTYFAPNVNLTAIPHVHLPHTNATSEAMSSGNRNALIESARISRGEIKDLGQLQELDFDALVFPGGFGAANVLSNWSSKGSQATVLADVQRVILAFHRAGKPMGATCIAPVLLAKVLGSSQVTLTIGDDAKTAAEIQKTGAHHVQCPVEDYISDRENKVLTTPAYMCAARPTQVFKGIRAMVRELVEMA